MIHKNYRVINASAGSGKTYALVLNLLSICLKHPNQPDRIGNILALTFTNKAANEMKHRIISWLTAFAGEDFAENGELKNIQQKMQAQGTEVSLSELHRRSKKILDYVLHNYSALNIGTIDKFNSRLVRSFSYELGLAQNFNLEINAEPYLVEAVEKMLEEIGDENEVSDAFMDFVNYSLDNDERVNLTKTLYNSAKEFVQDKHYFRLSQNKDFDWKVYGQAKQKLRDNIKTLKAESQQIAESCVQLFNERDLTIADFAGGSVNGIAKFFFETLKYFKKERPDIPFPKDEESALKTFEKGASSSGKKRQGEILEIIEFLIESRWKIIKNYIAIQREEKTLHALLPLKVNKDIQDKLAEIEDKNDVVLLSKFNLMIHEQLRTEPTAFIYEKVGTQFSHYFFDEFQDTSFLQWQNFIPLRDHAVNSDEMSFTLVGDPKQSIYRFRGGDSELMLDIINRKEKSQALADIENLEHNWRSAKNIVEFNNGLYQFLSTHTQESHCDIFGKGSQQIPKSSGNGRVRINLIENAKREIYFDEVANKMRTDLQDCLDNGFRFSDITILCRSNKEILQFSRLLSNLKVNYNGQEEYIKSVSESGLTLNLSSTLLALTEFLKWEQNPKNMQFPVKMLYHLDVLGRIKTEDFSAEMMQMLSCKTKPAMMDFVKNKYGLNLHSGTLLNLNLYNFVEHYLHEFSVGGKEADFLFNYLEMLYAFSQNAGANLKEFLRFWDEEAHDSTIQASDNLDAVKLMTIHKAKGLEFPVVFLPMANSHKDKKFNNWFDVKDHEGLASVNVKSFSSEAEVYDEELAKWNEENTYQNLIDRFCLQYVATTRAAEQLYLYIEKPNKTTNYLEIYDFLKTNILKDEQNEELSSYDLYPVSPEDLKKKETSETEKFITKSVTFKNEIRPNPEAIKIATPSKSYQNRVEKVRTGIFTHEVLSKINSAADVEKTLATYVLEGIITQDEKVEIAGRIFSIINDSRYARYFEAGQKIINEKDIMISADGESKIYRPDRLINTGDGYIILDFKTGDIKEKHQQQLNEYRAILEKLGERVLETELIYV